LGLAEIDVYTSIVVALRKIGGAQKKRVKILGNAGWGYWA
jgi:hypothetical protein